MTVGTVIPTLSSTSCTTFAHTVAMTMRSEQAHETKHRLLSAAETCLNQGCAGIAAGCIVIMGLVAFCFALSIRSSVAIRSSVDKKKRATEARSDTVTWLLVWVRMLLPLVSSHGPPAGKRSVFAHYSHEILLCKHMISALTTWCPTWCRCRERRTTGKETQGCTFQL